MNFNSKLLLALATMFVLTCTHIGIAQETFSRSDLQAVLTIVPNHSAIPTFELALINTGDRDLILNLGFMLANGRRQFPAAVHLTLRDPQSHTEDLNFKGPPVIVGRVDPLVVPLPIGARIILPINFADYTNPEQKNREEIHLSPGRYSICAEYTGKRVEDANLDMQGFRIMPYWTGTVVSNETDFTVANK